MFTQDGKRTTSLKWFVIGAATVIFGGCAVTPEPVEKSELDEQGEKSRQLLEEAQSPIRHPVRPSEAVARALLNNRQRRVRAMEAALKSQQLDASKFAMLPSLTASAGYTERSEYAASASVPFMDGEPQGTGGNQFYSVSQEKESNTYGIGFTWSILDFGLSYVRAQQKANQYLISQEQERKAMLNLAQDVRTAYWKAVSADRLLSKVDPLMEKVDAALEQSREIEKKRLSSPKEALSYQRSLLDIKRSLGSLREELIGAEQRLARLMGLPPSTDIPLPFYQHQDMGAPDLPVHVPTMERTAFMMRPEILSAEYRERIARKEVRVAFLKMFPDLSLSAAYRSDDNRFLRYNEWSTAGASVSWDLLQVFQRNAEKSAAEAEVELERERRHAASMAVLTQVHLSVLQFEHSQRKLKTANSYLDVSRGIFDYVESQAESESGGKLEIIKERLNALVAELRRDLAYAQVQNAFARIFKSMGLDPYPQDADTPARLAREIERRRTAWENGRLGVVVTPIAKQEPRLRVTEQSDTATFQFSNNTFSIAGDVEYSAVRADGGALPPWLEFNAGTRTFEGQPPDGAGQVPIRVRAENGSGVYAFDRFVLRMGEAT